MPRLFGTNGIRWVANVKSPDSAARLGAVAGGLFGRGKNIAIGMDTRTTSPLFYSAVKAGVMSAGCNITCLGIVPTPTVQYAVRELKLDGGLMVTASHNPPEFNGIKFFAQDGTEFSRAQEEVFEQLFSQEAVASAEWKFVGRSRNESHIHSQYKAKICSMIDLEKDKLLAIVDCANGTAIEYSPSILKNAGCRVMTLNSQPDGRFPGRMPEPVKENVGQLISSVKEQGADFGIAHDGDADRATFVDDSGKYVPGDLSLAIFALDALSRCGGRGTIVVPINTSKAVQDAVEAIGGDIEYTPIGSPFIARRMMENGAVFGGEGNGGAIFPDHQYCRDGMMAAARMADIITKRGPLSGILAELPKYSIKSDKIKIDSELKDRILRQLRLESDGEIIELDGIKSIHEDHWTIVRASGTEPIIRVTAETRSEELCGKILADKMNQVKEIIKALSGSSS